MFTEGNQIHNFMSSSGSGTVINYGSGSDFLTSYGSGSGSTCQKVTVPTVPVPVPQHWRFGMLQMLFRNLIRILTPVPDRCRQEWSTKKENKSCCRALSFFVRLNTFLNKKTIYWNVLFLYVIENIRTQIQPQPGSGFRLSEYRDWDPE